MCMDVRGVLVFFASSKSCRRTQSTYLRKITHGLEAHIDVGHQKRLTGPLEHGWISGLSID